MFTITGKKAGIIWDVEQNKPLVKFTNGIAETTCEAVAVKLRDMGYKVEGDFTPNDPLAEMSLVELKAYAKEHEIDLAGASKKKDILAKIREKV